jgi:lipoprotein-releasing system permease protein
LLQQKFGLLTLGSEGDFIVNAYPVEVQSLDVLLIMLTVVTIGMLVTLIPVQILKRNFLI